MQQLHLTPKESPAEELLRLTREIHQAVCGRENIPAKSSTQYYTHILELLDDGRAASTPDIINFLGTKGFVLTPNLVRQAMNRLRVHGEIESPMRNIYRKVKKEGAQNV